MSAKGRLWQGNGLWMVRAACAKLPRIVETDKAEFSQQVGKAGQMLPRLHCDFPAWVGSMALRYMPRRPRAAGLRLSNAADSSRAVPRPGGRAALMRAAAGNVVRPLPLGLCAWKITR